MSTILKITILALVLVLIGSGVWWVVSLQSPSADNNLAQNTNQNNQPSASEQNPETVVSGNSDASIESSFNEIDVEINSMTQDAEQVDQSLVP